MMAPTQPASSRNMSGSPRTTARARAMPPGGAEGALLARVRLAEDIRLTLTELCRDAIVEASGVRLWCLFPCLETMPQPFPPRVSPLKRRRDRARPEVAGPAPAIP